MSELIFPTVHLNGTSKKELLDQLLKAERALEEASKALANAMPHDRDYYPQGPTAGPEARLIHHNRMMKIREVQSELHAVAEHLLVSA